MTIRRRATDLLPVTFECLVRLNVALLSEQSGLYAITWGPGLLQSHVEQVVCFSAEAHRYVSPLSQATVVKTSPEGSTKQWAIVPPCLGAVVGAMGRKRSRKRAAVCGPLTPR